MNKFEEFEKELEQEASNEGQAVRKVNGWLKIVYGVILLVGYVILKLN